MSAKTKSKASGKAGPPADPDRSVTIHKPELPPVPRDIKHVSIAEIHIGPKSDRRRDEAFEAGVRELAASISADGLLQPIGVRLAATLERGPNGKPDVHDVKKPYVLVFGERRLRACEFLGWDKIPAVITRDEDDASRLRLVENVQRADIDEETKALLVGQRVAVYLELHLAGASPEGLSPAQRDLHHQAAIREVAQELGWPPRRVRDYAFMSDLPEKTRRLGAEGRLSLAHLKALAQVADPWRCDELAEEYAAGEDQADEPMRPLDNLKHDIEKELAGLGKVPWDKSVPIGDLPACDVCPHNSKFRTGLFDAGDTIVYHGDGHALTRASADDGICLKIECFKAKSRACKDQIRRAVGRVLTRAEKAPAKDRDAAAKSAIKEQSKAAEFVLPTVFGREVKERAEAKLKPSKSSGSGPKRQSDSPADKARRENEWRWNSAVRERNKKVAGLCRAKIGTLSAGVRAKLALVLNDVHKPEAIKAAAKRALNGSWSEAEFGELLKMSGLKPSDFIDYRWHYVLDKGSQAIDAVADGLGIKDIPPVLDKKQMLDAALAKLKTPDKPERSAGKGGKKKSGKAAAASAVDAADPDDDDLEDD